MHSEYNRENKINTFAVYFCAWMLFFCVRVCVFVVGVIWRKRPVKRKLWRVRLPRLRRRYSEYMHHMHACYFKHLLAL